MKTDRIIYWLPRVMAIIFLLFLSMFSLDVFDSQKSAGELVAGLFIHNIPGLVLLAVLVAAWRREIVGGVAFIAAGLLYIGFMVNNALGGKFEWYMVSYSLIIAGPAFLTGILFLMGWNRRKKGRQ